MQMHMPYAYNFTPATRSSHFWYAYAYPVQLYRVMMYAYELYLQLLPSFFENPLDGYGAKCFFLTAQFKRRDTLTMHMLHWIFPTVGRSTTSLVSVFPTWQVEFCDCYHCKKVHRPVASRIGPQPRKDSIRIIKISLCRGASISR